MRGQVLLVPCEKGPLDLLGPCEKRNAGEDDRELGVSGRMMIRPPRAKGLQHEGRVRLTHVSPTKGQKTKGQYHRDLSLNLSRHPLNRSLLMSSWSCTWAVCSTRGSFVQLCTELGVREILLRNATASTQSRLIRGISIGISNP